MNTESESNNKNDRKTTEFLFTCPRCGKRFYKSQTVAFPFCSNQCRRADLNKWLSEEYSVESFAQPEEDEDITE